eukprot:6705244-Ditylum_brightwellii.AAC.1
MQVLEPSDHAEAFGSDIGWVGIHVELLQMLNNTLVALDVVETCIILQVPLCGKAVTPPFMGTEDTEVLLFVWEIFSS